MKVEFSLGIETVSSNIYSKVIEVDNGTKTEELQDMWYEWSKTLVIGTYTILEDTE